MNILIYDKQQIPVEHLKHIIDAVKQTSGSEDWIALPKGIDIIQDAPVEYLEHYRQILDEQIKKYKEEQK